MKKQDKDIEMLTKTIEKRENQLDDDKIKDLEHELREKDEEMLKMTKMIQGNVIHELKHQSNQKEETITQMLLMSPQ